MICEILGHFLNTLTTDNRYFLPNSEKLAQPIQMQLHKKQITIDSFCQWYCQKALQ